MSSKGIQPKKENEIYCPNCAKPISKEAVICPYCRMQIREFKSSGEVKIPERKIEIKKKKPGGAKRALKTVGIIFAVIVILGTTIGLYWYRGECLVDSAQDAYYNGRPVEALLLYSKIEKQYPHPWWFFGDFAEWIPYMAAQARGYVYACNLKDSKNTEEAISAYESFLESYRGANALYRFLASKSLLELKLELARDLHSKKDYDRSIKTYQSITELSIFEGLDYEITEPREKWEVEYLETKSIFNDACLEADASIPEIYIEWINELEGNKDLETAIEKCCILLDEFSSDIDAGWIENRLADLYSKQAFQLMENNEYEQSIVMLEIVLSDYPDKAADLNIVDKIAEAYSFWAEKLIESEDYPEAIEKYETVLDKYPETAATQEIQLALVEAKEDFETWKKETRAVPVIEFDSEISRNDEDKWIVITVFKETGGKIGYTLKGEGWIVDTKGGQYGPWGTIINRGEVMVPPGGEGDSDYWFEGDKFIDGDAVFTWTGEDENGNYIEIEERIHLLP